MVGPSPVLAHVAQDVVLGHRLVLVVVDPDGPGLLLVASGVGRVGRTVETGAASVVIGVIQLVTEQRLVRLRVVYSVLVGELCVGSGGPGDGAVRSGPVRHGGLYTRRHAAAVGGRFRRRRLPDRGRVPVRLQVVDQLMPGRRRVERRQRL